MIRIYFKKYIYIILLLAISFIVFTYAKNQDLLTFNQINIQNEKNVKPDLFFKHIGYNPDSSKIYDTQSFNVFFERTKNLKERDGMIKDIKKYYSLPNKIILSFEERNPSYLIKYNKDSLFILDDSGMIINSNFLSSKIPEVDLIFNDFHIYHTFNNNIELNKLFKNIKKNRLNNQSLLNAFKILNSFYKLNLADYVKSVLIDSSCIKINFIKTEIIFDKNQNIEKQLIKFKRMMDALYINIDKVSFNEISDLAQIRLDINNQIIYKEE